MRTVFLPVVLFLVLACRTENLTDVFDRLVRAESDQDRERLVARVLRSHPSPETIVALIRGITFVKPESTGIVWGENEGIDGVKRPFYWYVPRTYDPAQKTPLLVWLHGGINRPRINPSVDWLLKNPPIRRLADTQNVILLFPLGEAGATWWNPVGAANILGQVRTTKRKFNIDDDRVWLSGFSDGASGAFFIAMTEPTDFAGFMPLNGHPGMASMAGGVETFLANLVNRPLSVVNTDLDDHYPAEKIRPIVDLVRQAGADVTFRVYTGIGHDFKYAPEEMPRLVEFMNGHPRVDHPSEIKWETAYPEFGRCMWLAVNSISPDPPAPLNQDITDSLFRRGLPSARAEATFLANTFTVRGSRLGAFSIYIDPDMVRLDQTVRVIVDGKEVFNKKVTVDPRFILENFLANRDRRLLYVNKVTIRL